VDVLFVNDAAGFNTGVVEFILMGVALCGGGAVGHTVASGWTCRDKGIISRSRDNAEVTSGVAASVGGVEDC